MDLAYDLRVALRGLSETFLNGKIKDAMDYVNHVQFFQNFTKEQVKELLQASTINKFPKGKTIVAEGEIDDTLYVILSGRVKIKKDNKDIASIGAGECFGEMAYICGQARSATVSAETECVLIKISATLMDKSSKDIQLLFYKNFATTLINRFSAQDPQKVKNKSDYIKDNYHIIQKLMQMPTLKALKEENLKELLRLSKVKKFKSGELIFEEDSYESLIYYLISGKTRIVKGGKEIAVLGHSGDVFGEMGPIEESVRSASVYAVDETVCVEIDITNIDRVLGDDKYALRHIIYRGFAEVLANRLRVTTEELGRTKKELLRLKSEKTIEKRD